MGRWLESGRKMAQKWKDFIIHDSLEDFFLPTAHTHIVLDKSDIPGWHRHSSVSKLKWHRSLAKVADIPMYDTTLLVTLQDGHRELRKRGADT